MKNQTRVSNLSLLFEGYFMQGLVTRRAARVDAAASDLLEVERTMEALIGVGDEESTPVADIARSAAMYHLESGGQRIRARLALHASESLGLVKSDAFSLAAAAELLHNASLVHDDLQDRDRARRDCETVWVVYGDEVAICAGDLLLSAAYCALAGVGDKRRLPQLISLTHTRITQAIRGQCVDLALLRTRPFSVDDYRRITIAKSGALLGLPIELALLAADKTDALAGAKRAADLFAIGYQIYDDLLDVEADIVRAGSAPAINIVQVLQAIHAASDFRARELARKLGLQYLLSAAAASADLPWQAGCLFQQLAIELHARLMGKRFR
ncbi:polyprenyl synthetase family protein [Polaromonas sp.]|uniref:polyprenyl synthetase family protein n=1 Tax=Polaromonas sp. TaxID=1869339 RepID=UPI001809CBB5|nr:polyprenyl synthetase family protein [Polaromonas sp.]NMM06078.1 polyprenyl synthetase family protein [Polaromonas sp.]